MASPSSNQLHYNTGIRTLAEFPLDAGPRRVKVQETEFGQLQCECRTYNLKTPTHAWWCPHIARTIDERIDGSEHGGIWWPTSSQRLSSLYVTVVLTPPLIVKVQLADEDDHRQRKVEASFGQAGWQFLCFINHGEGRKIIAEMVVQTLIGLYDVRPQCQSAFHKDPSIPHGLIDVGSSHALCDTYYLVAHGECFDCYQEPF